MLSPRDDSAASSGLPRMRRPAATTVSAASTALIGHQTPTTFNHVASSDERWTERYWYSGAPIDLPGVVLDLGLGWHPNRNVMDAFAGLTVNGVQTTYRASRRLGRDPLGKRIGPLSFQVIEALKRHRLALGENASGLSFELDRLAAFDGLQEAQSFRRKRNRVEKDLTRMTQFGRLQGWVELNGRRFEATPQSWWSQRDHSGKPIGRPDRTVDVPLGRLRQA